MKLLIALSVALFSTISFACANFSGKFLDNTKEQSYELIQNGCESIHYLYQDTSYLLITDNKEYLLDTFEIVIFGQTIMVELYNTSHFENDQLIHEGRTVTRYQDNREVTTLDKNVTTMTANGDLLTKTYYADGSVEEMLNERIK